MTTKSFHCFRFYVSISLLIYSLVLSYLIFGCNKNIKRMNELKLPLLTCRHWHAIALLSHWIWGLIWIHICMLNLWSWSEWHLLGCSGDYNGRCGIKEKVCYRRGLRVEWTIVVINENKIKLSKLLENMAPRLRLRTQHPTMHDTIMKIKRPDMNDAKNIHSIMWF